MNVRMTDCPMQIDRIGHLPRFRFVQDPIVPYFRPKWGRGKNPLIRMGQPK